MHKGSLYINWLIDNVLELAFKVSCLLFPRRLHEAGEFQTSCWVHFYCSIGNVKTAKVREILKNQFQRAMPSLKRIMLSRKRIDIHSFYTPAEIEDYFNHDTGAPPDAGIDFKTQQVFTDQIASINYQHQFEQL